MVITPPYLFGFYPLMGILAFEPEYNPVERVVCNAEMYWINLLIQ